jgi:ring-1,2-phenylacetyl-CoA epoxidase subunit PaaD
MTAATSTSLSVEVVTAAVATVADPEYPGVSIVDLGLLESVEVDGGSVTVGLIPTFSGCPALAMILEDVEAAVAALPDAGPVDVAFLPAPTWTPDRITDAGKAALGDHFTVAVQIGRAAPQCPRCGTETVEHSLFGPTRCRSVHRCPACDEIVEVIR